MPFTINSDHAPSLDLKPIVTTNKLGNDPIRRVITDGNTVIAFTGNRKVKLGIYHLGRPRPATKAEIASMTKAQPEQRLTGSCDIRSYDRNLYCTLDVKKDSWKHSKHFGTHLAHPPSKTSVTSAYCLSKNGSLLYWGLPSQIRVFEFVTRKKKEIARISAPGIAPTAMASTPGALIVGTALGEIFSFSFQQNVVHFILSLADEPPLSQRTSL